MNLYQQLQLNSYVYLERVAGIEPASSAWKAEVLPLNYTREPFPQAVQCHPSKTPPTLSQPEDRKSLQRA
jgi:hypothetical protein